MGKLGPSHDEDVVVIGVQVRILLHSLGMDAGLICMRPCIVFKQPAPAWHVAHHAYEPLMASGPVLIHVSVEPGLHA